MDSKVTVKILVENENQTTTPLETQVYINASVSQEIVFEFVSAADGGPIMRPKTPPRN